MTGGKRGDHVSNAVIDWGETVTFKRSSSLEGATVRITLGGGARRRTFMRQWPSLHPKIRVHSLMSPEYKEAQS